MNQFCNLGNEQVVDTLIRYGANVSAVSDEGFTPLFSAAQEGFCKAWRVF